MSVERRRSASNAGGLVVSFVLQNCENRLKDFDWTVGANTMDVRELVQKYNAGSLTPDELAAARGRWPTLVGKLERGGLDEALLERATVALEAAELTAEGATGAAEQLADTEAYAAAMADTAAAADEAADEAAIAAAEAADIAAETPDEPVPGMAKMRSMTRLPVRMPAVAGPR